MDARKDIPEEVYQYLTKTPPEGLFPFLSGVIARTARELGPDLDSWVPTPEALFSYCARPYMDKYDFWEVSKPAYYPGEWGTFLIAFCSVLSEFPDIYGYSHKPGWSDDRMSSLCRLAPQAVAFDRAVSTFPDSRKAIIAAFSIVNHAVAALPDVMSQYRERQAQRRWVLRYSGGHPPEPLSQDTLDLVGIYISEGILSLD